MSEKAVTETNSDKSPRRMLVTGFLLGVLVSFLVLVVLAIEYGPRSESITVDLYSGHTIVHRSFLWKRSEIPQPESPHVRWAIEHQSPVRKWYLPCSSMSSGWFQPAIAADFTTREYVYQIYSLKVPEEDKVKLLHQYHEQLDALKLKERELDRTRRFMERFYEDWEQKLKDLETQEAQ